MTHHRSPPRRAAHARTPRQRGGTAAVAITIDGDVASTTIPPSSAPEARPAGKSTT
ncbi:hypothetical protein ACU686_37920 [Yinghuangia aomiensis]